MKTVEIFVPYDSGFASGGDGYGPSFDNLFFLVCDFIGGIVFSFRCAFTPFKVLKERSERKEYLKKIDLNHKAWQEENIKSGKNLDGSFTKIFPADTKLREALIQCELFVHLEETGPESIVRELGDKPLGDLTKEQIDRAVMFCQISAW